MAGGTGLCGVCPRRPSRKHRSNHMKILAPGAQRLRSLPTPVLNRLAAPSRVWLTITRPPPAFPVPIIRPKTRHYKVLSDITLSIGTA
jgi:hypothetical protein